MGARDQGRVPMSILVVVVASLVPMESPLYEQLKFTIITKC